MDWISEELQRMLDKCREEQYQLTKRIIEALHTKQQPKQPAHGEEDVSR